MCTLGLQGEVDFDTMHCISEDLASDKSETL